MTFVSKLIFYYLRCYVQHWNQMANYVWGNRTPWVHLHVFTEVASLTFISYSTLHSLQVKHNWKCDSEDLFERELVLVSQEIILKESFLPSLFKKKIPQKGAWSWIYFVAYSWFDTKWVSCFHARNEIRKGFLPLIASMLFVSIKPFARNGFCDIFGLCWFIVLCDIRA